MMTFCTVCRAKWWSKSLRRTCELQIVENADCNAPTLILSHIGLFIKPSPPSPHCPKLLFPQVPKWQLLLQICELRQLDGQLMCQEGYQAQKEFSHLFASQLTISTLMKGVAERMKNCKASQLTMSYHFVLYRTI